MKVTIKVKIVAIAANNMMFFFMVFSPSGYFIFIDPSKIS